MVFYLLEHTLSLQRGQLEDEAVDVEGDTEEYEEYTWASQTRIRAASLLDGGFSGMLKSFTNAVF